MDRLSTKLFNVFLVFLGFIATLPIVAPILLHLGMETPAKGIYFIYSFFCHQFSTRSIYLYDIQYAWCARDTGIWLAIFFSAILVKINVLPKIKWYWVAPFFIPIVLDGGIQTVFTLLNLTPQGVLDTSVVYISNNFIRFLTGSFFGLGFGWFFSQILLDREIGENIGFKFKNNFEKLNKFRNFILVFIFMTLMTILYIVLIQLWNITSIKNLPDNNLDSSVKTSQNEFFIRREDGICPTTDTSNLFNLDCFLK